MIDSSDLVRKIEKIIEYGTSFMHTVNGNRLMFNIELSNKIIDALYSFLDSKAQMQPKALHHVYEPGMIGDPSGRLFEFNANVTVDEIIIYGKFLESTGTPLAGGDPFREKARIMESGITITIEPVHGDFLAFMDDGELVITSSSVTIEHPGGIEVEKSFGDTVYSFLNSYLIKSTIDPILSALANPVEFDYMFAEGAAVGSTAGNKAAMKYMNRSFNESF